MSALFWFCEVADSCSRPLCRDYLCASDFVVCRFFPLSSHRKDIVHNLPIGVGAPARNVGQRRVEGLLFCAESWRHIDCFPRQQSRWTPKFVWDETFSLYNLCDNWFAASFARHTVLFVMFSAGQWEVLLVSSRNKLRIKMTTNKVPFRVLINRRPTLHFTPRRCVSPVVEVSVLWAEANRGLCNGEPPSAKRCSCCWGF